MKIFLGLMIPFIGTIAGAGCVFFMRNELKPRIQKSLLGFASGVMVAASVWSLLLPSIEMAEPMGKMAFLPAAAGFLLGVIFLLSIDHVIPHLHLGGSKPEGKLCGLKRRLCLYLQ